MHRSAGWTPAGAALLVVFFALVAVWDAAVAAPAPPAAASAELERRVLVARQRGYWVIEEGDHLGRIGRAFHPGDSFAAAALRKFLLQRNPVAFIGGDRDVLVVGAKLFLPPDLVFAKSPPPSPPATPAAAPALAAGQEPPSVPVAAPSPGKAPAGETRAPVPSATVAGPEAATPVGQPIEVPYVDRLIEGAAMPGREVEPARINDTPGRRLLAAEHRAGGRWPPGGGRGIEQGFDLRYRTETLDYGTLFFDGSFRHTDPAPFDRSVASDRGSRATLYHERFPLSVDWIADSALGVVRTPPSPLLSSSYRIFLPTSLIAGASTVISDGRQDWTAYVGEVGRLEGSATQTFDRTTGRLAGFGYTRRLGSQWNVGGQVVGLRESAAVPDHESLTLAIERVVPSSTDRLKLQVVADSHDRFAGWFDGDTRLAGTRHRYGVYHLDPHLSWGDTQVVSDQRGAYWRGDARSLGSTLSWGADASETNLRDDPARAKLAVASAYGTATLRIDRNLSLGGGATFARSDARNDRAADSRTVSANAFATWNNPLGLSRLDYARYRTTTEGFADQTVDTLAWTQDWPAIGPVALNSTLNVSRETVGAERTTRSSLGLSLRGPTFYDLSWDASIVYGRIEAPPGTEDNLNVNANAYWNFARNWFLTAQLSVNTFDPLPAIPGIAPAPTQRDKRLLLGVRYEEARGVAYQALGLGAAAGSGRLRGVVFFDDNGDGLRQAIERGAAGIVVYLDGRVPTTTDAEGRFAFPVVPPGAHALRILNETLPLPWTIEDERGFAVQVPLRGEAAVEIPLAKIRP